MSAKRKKEGSKRKRKERSKNLEKCKKKRLIDKLKSMHSEPREPSRLRRDMPERLKSSTCRRDRDSSLSWMRLEPGNLRRKRTILQDLLNLKEMSFRELSKSKRQVRRENEQLRSRSDAPSLTIEKI